MSTKRPISLIFLLGLPLVFYGTRATAQDNEVSIRVNVNLVQLNVAVTDRKGRYVTGLLPEDFVITEDNIPEKIATFEEGNGPTLRVVQGPADAPSGDQSAAGAPSHSIPASQPVSAARSIIETLGTAPVGANVFILFDTSNYMYRGFVFAQDAIADFVRSLDDHSKIAFYSYSRDLSRSAPLTSDRMAVLRGVRSAVAGDDAALYNSLLLTVKDAAQYTGRKVVVVFSNGPDDASMVPPEDVAELAQSTGTVIYMISTHQTQMEPISTAVFERMSKDTGGKAYFAKSWKAESQAFSSIRDDLAHLYALSYYPQPNSNTGWRTIKVKLVGPELKNDRVRSRDGYRLQVTERAPDVVAAGAGPE
jgi:VWFA-related protein